MPWPRRGEPGARAVTYVEFRCAWCSKAVRKERHNAGHGKFCSRACAAAMGRRHGHEAVETMSCPQCGSIFERWNYDTGRRYCSMACRREHEQLRRPETLRRLSASAAARSANRRASQWQSVGVLTYADILALWDRQPVCVECGRGRGIDHIVGLFRGGTNTPDNLQTMCQRCNQRKRWREQRSSVIRQ